MNQARSMFYSDWDLDAIVMHLNNERDDDFSHAVDLIQQGDIDEADNALNIEISRYPWVMLAAAYVKLKKDQVDEALHLLRAVTLIAKDSIVQLWAWHNLRAHGKNPPAAMAQQVLGLVIEVPYEDSVDVLASYADGTARYLNHQGGLIIWDTFDELITPLIYDGIRLARPMGSLEQFHSDDPLPDGEVRLSVLTPGGVYIWEGSPEDGSDVARLFAQQANLLRALVQMVLDNKKEADGEEE